MRGALHPLMLAGTGSDVGKSVLATALCRIFLQDGYHPAPFKAQNMALNSYATPQGLEIGRAQAVQADAAGIPCHTDMNPLLLKPQSDHTSQVVLNGRPIGTQSAFAYFRKEGREELRSAVCAAFDRLQSHYNPIVMEGAGSIAEINLRDTDLVNMPMAMYAGADVLLVADIDRGGVFASVYGTIMLLTPEERRHVKGIIINKFRGDARLFESGRRMLEQLCQLPVLGVVPYFNDIHIEAEDSVALSSKSWQAAVGKINIAVVRLSHISNFTDFDRLEHDTRVHLFYTHDVGELEKADLILLPGSKTTIDDLRELWQSGLAEAIIRAQRRGIRVMGICGGYQMMGMEVLDPEHIEGNHARMPGLGLLPVSTQLTSEKITRQVRFRFAEAERESAFPMQGYEIHMGRTTLVQKSAGRPLLLLEDGLTPDGCIAPNGCMGTYVHGVLDNAQFIEFLLAPLAEKMAKTESLDYQAFKQQQYDRLADHVRQYVDIPRLYDILQGV